MRFEKIWIEQCRATRAIKRRFGVKDALDYLVGEKLAMFARTGERHPGRAHAQGGGRLCRRRPADFPADL